MQILRLLSRQQTGLHQRLLGEPAIRHQLQRVQLGLQRRLSHGEPHAISDGPTDNATADERAHDEAADATAFETADDEQAHERTGAPTHSASDATAHVQAYSGRPSARPVRMAPRSPEGVEPRGVPELYQGRTRSQELLVSVSGFLRGVEVDERERG